MNRVIVPGIALAASFAGAGLTFAAVNQMHDVQSPSSYPWPDLPRDESIYQGPDSTACRIKGDQGVRNGQWVNYVCEMTTDAGATSYGEWRLHTAV